MNKTSAWLAPLLALALTLSSCLGDNDDDTTYTYYGDTAITAFTLGTVNRYLSGTTAAGNDTTLSSTVTGSSYAFTIDQTTAQIYNTDSLPYGCDLEAVLATISSKNSGYIYLKSMTSDSLTYYSSSDSIDFTKPRTVRVYAQDATRYRDYTVTVNMHNELSGVLNWSRQDSLAIGDAPTAMTLATGDGRLNLFYTQGGETKRAQGSWADAAASQWQWTGTSSQACDNVCTVRGDLYRVADGNLYRNDTLVAASAGIKAVVAGSTTQTYALSTSGALLMSADRGATWTEETLADDAALLPTDVAGYTCYAVKTNTDMERVTIVGTRSGDTHATVWTKLVDYSDAPMSTRWTIVDTAGDTKYSLPALTGLTVLPYNGYAWAFGYQDGDFSPIYQSKDGGITWKTDTGFALPTDLTATPVFAATVDSHNYIWLVNANGSTRRGRLTDLGWE